MTTSSILLDRPTWNSSRKKGYWRKRQCSESCVGHIVPFDRVDEINIVYYPVDLVQWVLVRAQELSKQEALVNAPKKKKPYTGSKSTRPHVKIFGE